MVTIVDLIFFISAFCNHHHALAVEPSVSPLFALSEHEHTVTSIPMQSVLLPCQAIVTTTEPEQVIWYKLTDAGQSTLSVGKHLITRDARFSVAYYSLDHGISPAKWDLHLTHVRLSDAAQYQCHIVSKETHRSSRSTVQLVVEDIVVHIQSTDLLISVGERAKFTCNFTGEHRVRQEDIAWLKDDQPLVADATRVITSTQLANVTVTTLEILASRPSDTGSYRCSDGHGVQSKEARLYLRDVNQPVQLRSLSSSSSVTSTASMSSMFRTVFYLFILHFLPFAL